MLEGLKPIKRQYPCRIQSELSKMSEADRKILIGALNDHDLWPARTLSSQLKAIGKIVISDSTITRHRKRLCSCGAK